MEGRRVPATDPRWAGWARNPADAEPFRKSGQGGREKGPDRSFLPPRPIREKKKKKSPIFLMMIVYFRRLVGWAATEKKKKRRRP